MRLSRFSLQTLELNRTKPTTARPNHIKRLLDREKDTEASHQRGGSFTPHLTFSQLRWSTPGSTVTSSAFRRPKTRPVLSNLARSKAKLQLLSRKPRTSKSVFRIHLSTQPQPVRICWEKFKPVTPVKPISSESRLLRKLLLSGLLLTH